jgi:hypothetical protein
MFRTAQQHRATSDGIVLVATLLAAFWLLAADNQVARAQTAPAATTSRYMATIDGSTLYNEGCSQGRAAENGIVVLDFGQPWVQGGSYGTILYDARGSFASIAQIEYAVEQFLRGYWVCSPTNTFVRLGIGTSNYRGATGAAHGGAWGALVDAVAAWIVSPPSYASQEAARGANDIEMGWNTPAASRAWVDAYAAASSTPYYNYGDCEGCPTGGAVLPIPGRTINNGWTQEDVWYVSYGVTPAFPLPEIYLTNGVNAVQWQQLSLYASENHGRALYFLGAMTQYQACVAGGGCPGADNRPSTGWTQLSGALNSDSRTAQRLNWSTDISWAN